MRPCRHRPPSQYRNTVSLLPQSHTKLSRNHQSQSQPQHLPLPPQHFPNPKSSRKPRSRSSNRNSPRAPHSPGTTPSAATVRPWPPPNGPPPPPSTSTAWRGRTPSQPRRTHPRSSSTSSRCPCRSLASRRCRACRRRRRDTTRQSQSARRHCSSTCESGCSELDSQWGWLILPGCVLCAACCARRVRCGCAEGDSERRISMLRMRMTTTSNWSL